MLWTKNHHRQVTFYGNNDYSIKLFLSATKSQLKLHLNFRTENFQELFDMDSKILLIIGLVFSFTCNSVIAKGGFRPPKSDLTKHFKVNQIHNQKYKQKSFSYYAFPCKQVISHVLYRRMWLGSAIVKDAMIVSPACVVHHVFRAFHV